MAGLTPYIHFPGTAPRGGSPEAIAHGYLVDAPVSLYVADVGRGWGASDGQVIDRYGLHWLIGFEDQPGD
jgi:hypothetical protein